MTSKHRFARLLFLPQRVATLATEWAEGEARAKLGDAIYDGSEAGQECYYGAACEAVNPQNLLPVLIRGTNNHEWQIEDIDRLLKKVRFTQ